MRILGEYTSQQRHYRLVAREGQPDDQYYLPFEFILQFLFQESHDNKPEVWLDVEFEEHEPLDPCDNIPTQHVTEMLKQISNEIRRK